jgi:benzoyl-CoA-dihydrodiol lyase
LIGPTRSATVTDVMDMPAAAPLPPVRFEIHPDRYRHWQLDFPAEHGGRVARLTLDVKEDGGLRPGYPLKLNSYDLGVDIELADALQRIRFEHPEVGAIVFRSAKDRIFCSGANIYMLGTSTHAFKVNFCKFTNETRLYLEQLSAESGVPSLAAVNGTASGGGYELAMACDEILLQDDGSSAVSLPETPLLGVLPGTGGLTRLSDKRKIRRDLADVFSTLAEGVRGKRAVEWRLVDETVGRSQFEAAVNKRLEAMLARSKRPAGSKGIVLPPLEAKRSDDRLSYRYVEVSIDHDGRVARIVVRGPDGPQPETAEAMHAAGADQWALRAFRELDDALLELRFNHLDVGLLVLETKGDLEAVRAVDRTLARLAESDWLAKEIVFHMKRVLKRLDLSSRSIFALVEPGSCFAGSLLELALAADRVFMKDGDEKVHVAISPMNGGALPMSNGLSRLASRFFAEPERATSLAARAEPLDTGEALEAGLVTYAPDDIDWDDEVRVAIEERASMSPDALTAMEANLRFGGPETMETKIFGRLSAWQNWIFQRPNAVGEEGALKRYGTGQKPVFDTRRV